MALNFPKASHGNKFSRPILRPNSNCVPGSEVEADGWHENRTELPSLRGVGRTMAVSKDKI